MPKRKKRENIRVSEPVQMRLSELNSAPYNPNEMTKTELESLKASIRLHGAVEPLIIQRRSPKYGKNVILGGHQRAEALRQLCVEYGQVDVDIWVVVKDVDDSQAMQLNLALNMHGTPDEEKLGLLFVDLVPTMADTDYLACGYTSERIDELMALVSNKETVVPDAPVEFGKSITLSLKFSTIEARDKAKRIIRLIAEKSNMQSGEAVLAQLKATQ